MFRNRTRYRLAAYKTLPRTFRTRREHYLPPPTIPRTKNVLPVTYSFDGVDTESRGQGSKFSANTTINTENPTTLNNGTSPNPAIPRAASVTPIMQWRNMIAGQPAGSGGPVKRCGTPRRVHQAVAIAPTRHRVARIRGCSRRWRPGCQVCRRPVPGHRASRCRRCRRWCRCRRTRRPRRHHRHRCWCC